MPCPSIRPCFIPAALFLFAISIAPAHGQAFVRLHDFTGAGGSHPVGTLCQAGDGYLYGTTFAGGANGLGTIFRATLRGAVTVIHSFGGADGSGPRGGLVVAKDGNLYGTTYTGGAHDDGSIFRITTGGVFTSLYSFTALDGSTLKNDDGGQPICTLALGADNALYGTTSNGGTGASGVVFRITTGGVFTNLHSLVATGANEVNAEGAWPQAGLAAAKDGALYGVGVSGGAQGKGAVFKITTGGAFTLLYSFPGGADGGSPQAELVQAADGNLYGTTTVGGNGSGTVFRITTLGAMTTAHTFSGNEGTPLAESLLQARDGNLYGCAWVGGANGKGSFFRMNGSGGDLFTLHSFDGTDGQYCYAGLMQASDGNLYGVTRNGGNSDNGVLFRWFLPGNRLLVQNQNDYRISLLTLNTWQTIGSSKTTSPNLPAGWRVGATGDFDFDGQMDIVVQNTSTRAISILYMNGTTVRASTSVNPTLPPNWELVATGDLSGDGRPDLIVQNMATQQVSALIMDGAKIVGSVPLSSRLALGWKVVGAGDFDRDGQTDLLVQNGTTRQLSVLTLNGAVITGSVPLLPTLPPGWLVRAIVDMTGEGTPDLIAQESSSGRISVLEVRDMKIQTSWSITPSPGAAWRIVGPR